MKSSAPWKENFHFHFRHSSINFNYCNWSFLSEENHMKNICNITRYEIKILILLRICCIFILSICWFRLNACRWNRRLKGTKKSKHHKKKIKNIRMKWFWQWQATYCLQNLNYLLHSKFKNYQFKLNDEL